MKLGLKSLALLVWLCGSCSPSKGPTEEKLRDENTRLRLQDKKKPAMETKKDSPKVLEPATKGESSTPRANPTKKTEKLPEEKKPPVASSVKADDRTKILIVGGLGKGQDETLYEKFPIVKGPGRRFTLNKPKTDADYHGDFADDLDLQRLFDIIHFEWIEDATKKLGSYENAIKHLDEGGFLIIDGLSTEKYKVYGLNLMQDMDSSCVDAFKTNKKRLYNAPFETNLKNLPNKENFKAMARVLLMLGFDNIKVLGGTTHPVNGREGSDEIWLEAQLKKKNVNFPHCTGN